MFDKPSSRLVSFVVFVAATAVPGCSAKEPEPETPAVQITETTPVGAPFPGPFAPAQPAESEAVAAVCAMMRDAGGDRCE